MLNACVLTFLLNKFESKGKGVAAQQLVYCHDSCVTGKYFLKNIYFCFRDYLNICFKSLIWMLFSLSQFALKLVKICLRIHIEYIKIFSHIFRAWNIYSAVAWRSILPIDMHSLPILSTNILGLNDRAHHAIYAICLMIHLPNMILAQLSPIYLQRVQILAKGTESMPNLHFNVKKNSFAGCSVIII